MNKDQSNSPQAKSTHTMNDSTQKDEKDMTHSQPTTNFDPLPYGTYSAGPYSAPTAAFASGENPTSVFATSGIAGGGYAVAGAPFADVDPAPDTERSGSPMLGLAGALSLGVAVWVLIGTPTLGVTAALVAGIAAAAIVGLLLILRK